MSSGAELDALLVNTPHYLNGVHERENAAMVAEEREEPHSSTSPLDVFGNSRLIGSPPLARDLLPPVIERRAADVAVRLGVDPAMVALPMLATCAGCIDDRIHLLPLQHDTSWRESARLWIALVADSGQKKTPAINAALAPLRAIEREWMATDTDALRRYEEQQAIHTAAEMQQRRSAARALAKGEELTLPPLPHPPRKPPLRRKEIKDTTVEALSEVFADNQWGLLAVYDELTNWFGSFDAYRTEKTKKDRSLYLEAYNGGAQIIDRVSRGRVYITNWSLSLIGGIQPTAMRKLAADLTDDGLAQRFIVIFTQSDGITCDQPEDETLRVAYEQVLRRLLTWDIGGPEARILCRFSPEATRYRTLINQRIQSVRAMPWVTSGFHTHLSKWEGLFPRLCLTWHCVTHVDEFPFPETVSADTAGKVATFMLEYLLPHASRFYTELLGAKENEQTARWIAGHILAHDLHTISVRDIGRAYRQLRTDTEGIQHAMKYLTLCSWVTPLDGTAHGEPRRWKVNSEVHTKFAVQRMREKVQRAATIRAIQSAVRDFPELNGNDE